MKVIDRIKAFSDFLKSSLKSFDGFNVKKYKYYKKTIVISSMIIAFFIIGFFIYQSGFSYQVTMNGEEIGVVKDTSIAEQALKEVEEEVFAKHGERAHFDSDIEYERVRVKKDLYLDQDQVFELILKKAEVLKPATVIVIDGEEKLIVSSEEIAEDLLDEIKKPYIKKAEGKENIDVLEVTFSQKLEIKSKNVSPEKILTKEQAEEKISEGIDGVQTYTVVKGDNDWNISRSFNLGVRTLQEANPGQDMEKLKPGQVINLYVEKPFVDVKTIEKHIINESINYKTEEKKDSSLYVDQKKVIKEGKKGKKEIVAKITFVNGVEESREILQEKVLEEPQTRLVNVGTKSRPKTATKSANRKPAPTYKGDLGSSITKTALGYRGTRYVRGGSSPSGFDCSGFTRYVYGQYGIWLPHSAAAQGSMGGYVAKGDLRPGDLVRFTGHVGIYIGGGNFVHAPSRGKRVQVDSLSSSYWSRKFIGGRRIY